ncbi:MAG: uracil-DNA glycosylase [Halofilum sp. (in: g-proteobacteria)]|nr:uracil-DNA glycosylase [Halofilum sp. (in: g-proteobacteria)]
MDGTLRAAILGCTACELRRARTQAVPGWATPARTCWSSARPRAGGGPPRRALRRARRPAPRPHAGGDRPRPRRRCSSPTRSSAGRRGAATRRPEEVRACAGYLRRQIELIAPRAILSVGRISAQSLLETGDSIGRLRGRWHRFGPQGTPLLVTYHPAYLLRSPVDKRKAWADLKAVRERLRGVSE